MLQFSFYLFFQWYTVGYEVKKMKKIGGILKNGCPLNVFIYLFPIFLMLLQNWPSSATKGFSQIWLQKSRTLLPIR